MLSTWFIHMMKFCSIVSNSIMEEQSLSIERWTPGRTMQLELRSLFSNWTQDTRTAVPLSIESFQNDHLVLKDVQKNYTLQTTDKFQHRHEVETTKNSTHIKYLFLEVNEFFRSSFPGAVSICHRYLNGEIQATFYVYL